MARSKKKPFDKYQLYRASVQSPDTDVEFFRDTYRALKRRSPVVFREDFCGTFALSCEWVKAHRTHRAVGIDLDPEPLRYGREHYLPEIKPEQQRRLKTYQKNVLSPGIPKADIIAAMNFSYFLFKRREDLKKYFRGALKGLKPGGLFFVDCFGGPACGEANEDCTKLPGFKYFWDQESFDPVTNYAVFHIHFQRRGERKRKYVFSYDWRLWSIPELREIMQDVGFKKTHVYWEGTARDGSGNGIFKKTNVGEECEAYVAYVVGER